MMGCLVGGVQAARVKDMKAESAQAARRGCEVGSMVGRDAPMSVLIRTSLSLVNKACARLKPMLELLWLSALLDIHLHHRDRTNIDTEHRNPYLKLIYDESAGQLFCTLSTIDVGNRS